PQRRQQSRIPAQSKDRAPPRSGRCPHGAIDAPRQRVRPHAGAEGIGSERQSVVLGQYVAVSKGSISEFELGVLRARMLDAARAKARRGELSMPIPIGYIWHREVGLGFDPDLRIQEVVRLIFARFRQLGSARQVLLSMLAEQVHFPRPSDG